MIVVHHPSNQIDSLLTIADDGDPTKKIAFQASGITTGTTRTITVPDANITLVGTAASQALSGKTITLAAGTTSVAPLVYTSGTNLTTPAAGAAEYDGAQLYFTANTTSDRGDVPVEHIFRLGANGSAIGATIADFFGANSAINLPATSSWELTAHLYYLKSTAGTVTYTITNSAADYTNIVAKYQQSPAAGLGTASTSQLTAGIVSTTTAAAALPATTSLTDAANHYAVITATIEMNAAGNIRIRCTESAGTITPLRGSFYKVRRIPASVGDFVA